MEIIQAGANRYVLRALGFIWPTEEDLLKADFIKEIKDFLPKLEEYRKSSK